MSGGSDPTGAGSERVAQSAELSPVLLGKESSRLQACSACRNPASHSCRPASSRGLSLGMRSLPRIARPTAILPTCIAVAFAECTPLGPVPPSLDHRRQPRRPPAPHWTPTPRVGTQL